MSDEPRTEWAVQIEQCGEWDDLTVVPNDPHAVTLADIDERSKVPSEHLNTMSYGEWKANSVYDQEVRVWPDVRHRLIKRTIIEEVLKEHLDAKPWPRTRRPGQVSTRYNAVGLPYMEDEDQI
jgi:hypothetical protein